MAVIIQDNRIFLSGMESYAVPGCETLINVNFCAVSERAAVDLPGRAIGLVPPGLTRRREILLERKGWESGKNPDHTAGFMRPSVSPEQPRVLLESPGTARVIAANAEYQ